MANVVNNYVEALYYSTNNSLDRTQIEKDLQKFVKISNDNSNLKKILKYVDVMVSRAGATTISEIIAYKIPSILIPSPHVTDNHQYKNALNLFDKNASLLIEEKNLNSDILIKNIEYLLYDKISVLKMKDNLKSMQIKGGASKIYNLIIELTGE